MSVREQAESFFYKMMPRNIADSAESLKWLNLVEDFVDLCKNFYDEGYKMGYTDWYDKGHEDGYDKGYEDGYDKGYEDGCVRY
jgi:flagellar biosynthesis/type III secretory pathway protein FliH